MLKTLRKLLSRLSFNTISNIPEDQKKELVEELLNINLRREQLFCLLILFLDIILMLIDIAYLMNKWDKVPAYRNLFYSHIIIVFPLILFLLVTDNNGKIYSRLSQKAKEYLHLGIVALMIYWGAFLSINAQMIHGQISAYIICAIGIGSIVLLKAMEGLAIFASSQLVFIVGLYLVQNDAVKIIGGIVNSTFLIALAFFISKMTFFLYVNNYMRRKIIEKKTFELNKINSNLEKLVNERTEELTLANRQLISEMETRYRAELETAAARIIYEEKEKAFDKAIELEKLRTAFFANISHEFKTPLNVVLSAGQLLEHKLRNAADPDIYNQVSRHTEMIKQNSYRLIRLVSNLLDMNKIDVGYFELNLKNHDIVKVVEDIVMSVAEFIESKDIKLVFDTIVEEKVIACDADKIERVMLNLLSNAVKFTPRNGTILVNMYMEEEVIISVKDTGTGIPEEKLSSIFERYVQAENSLVRNREGSGIGLSLVKSIIEMHQGTIKVNSKQGKGSEFIIRLPNCIVTEYAPLERSESFSTNKKIDMINIEFSDIYL
ncbi:MAG: sensor histidine kinase [Clostridia bacterium]